MHFLVHDAGQDERVREQYGAPVLAKLRRERSRMIRMIFGTYALVGSTAINPYRLYHRVFGHDVRTEMRLSRWQRALGMPRGVFKVVALPLRIAFWAFRGLAVAGHWFWVFILNVLADVEMEQEKPDFEACVRKITRMRGPVTAEATAIRGRFDFVYTGCRSADDKPSPCIEDLRSVGAPEDTLREFTSLRERWRQDLGDLQRFLDSHEGAKCRGEALRAVQMAYLVNEGGLKTKIRAIPCVEGLARAIAEGAFVWPRWGAMKALRHRLAWLLTLGHDEMTETLRQFRDLTGLEMSRASRMLFKAYVRDVEGTREAILTFVAAGGAPDERAVEQIQSIANGRYREWTDELITVRTLHALSLLDRRNYEVSVYQLGQFAEVGAELPQRARTAPASM